MATIYNGVQGNDDIQMFRTNEVYTVTFETELNEIPSFSQNLTTSEAYQGVAGNAGGLTGICVGLCPSMYINSSYNPAYTWSFYANYYPITLPAEIGDSVTGSLSLLPKPRYQ